MPAGIAGCDLLLRASSVPDEIPLLGSRLFLSQMGGIIDSLSSVVYFTLLQQATELFLSENGHLCIIIDNFSSKGFPRSADRWARDERHEFACGRLVPLKSSVPRPLSVAISSSSGSRSLSAPPRHPKHKFLAGAPPGHAEVPLGEARLHPLALDGDDDEAHLPGPSPRGGRQGAGALEPVLQLSRPHHELAPVLGSHALAAHDVHGRHLAVLDGLSEEARAVRSRSGDDQGVRRVLRSCSAVPDVRLPLATGQDDEEVGGDGTQEDRTSTRRW